MFEFYFFLSIFFCFLSFISMDPLKSSLLLVTSFIFGISFYSIFSIFWLNYFITLLFLSGVFLIIVYISSLSKMYFFFLNSYFFFFFSLFFFPMVFSQNFFFDLEKIYYVFFLFFIFWIFFLIFFFLLFLSYFLSFFGSLRKF